MDSTRPSTPNNALLRTVYVHSPPEQVTVAEESAALTFSNFEAVQNFLHELSGNPELSELTMIINERDVSILRTEGSEGNLLCWESRAESPAHIRAHSRCRECINTSTLTMMWMQISRSPVGNPCSPVSSPTLAERALSPRVRA